MTKTALKWGIGGAVVSLVVNVLLIMIQKSLPYQSSVRECVRWVVYAIVYPVAWVWETAGVHGDDGMRLIIPIFGSYLVYYAGTGFAAGVLIQKTASSR